MEESDLMVCDDNLALAILTSQQSLQLTTILSVSHISPDWSTGLLYRFPINQNSGNAVFLTNVNTNKHLYDHYNNSITDTITTNIIIIKIIIISILAVNVK